LNLPIKKIFQSKENKKKRIKMGNIPISKEENEDNKIKIFRKRKENEILEKLSTTIGIKKIATSTIKYQKSENNIIGKGEFTTVYLGTISETPVAIKEYTTLKEEYFMNEITITKNIKHENFFQTIGYSTSTEGNLLIISEYEKGELLSSFMEKNNFTIEQKYKTFIQICNGMDYLYSKKIVMKNLLLENIFITKNQNIKILDFKHAKYTSQKTKLETYKIDPVYMPPEYITRNEDLESLTSTDVFFFGNLMYQILFEIKPWSIEEITKKEQIIEKYENKEFPIIKIDDNLDDQEVKILTFLIKIMKPCWFVDPFERPKFEDLKLILINNEDCLRFNFF
jgi:serine/threonine protein kinase